MQEKQEKIRLTLLWLSMVLYVAACLTTALILKREGSPNEAMPGWNVLAVGWVGMLINQWGWFANLFLLLGLIFGFLRLFRAGKISTSIALLVSAVSIPMLFSQDVPANEGGVGPPFKLAELGIGCWLWLGSQLLVLTGNFGIAKKPDSAAANESEKNRPESDVRKESEKDRPESDARKESEKDQPEADARKESEKDQPESDARKESEKNQPESDARKESEKDQPGSDAAKESEKNQPESDARKE